MHTVTNPSSTCYICTITREVMDKLYTPNPDGYCGDEDNGQTSAWYVFSAMGFYPVCPGTDQYVMGTPYFKQMKLHLENGKTVQISAPSNSDEELMNGAKITMKMSSTPNKQRGVRESDFPYSFSKEVR